MPYIQSIAVFLIVVLDLTGYLEIGDLSPTGPNLYLQIVLLVSFFVGLWGLFMFFDITHRFKLLENGDSKRSAIKQVASGRFGVTTEYLVNADMIQFCRQSKPQQH